MDTIMNAFIILANIEAVLGEVEFSTKGKSIIIARTISDEQVDAALHNIPNIVGNVFHGINKTIIEMV